MQVLNLAFLPTLAVVVVALVVFSGPGAQALCSDAACSAACDKVTLNNGALGHCDSNYPNPLYGNDPSCICDACPPGTLLDIVNLDVLTLQCRGPGLQSSCTACPLSQPFGGQVNVPHICTVTLPGGTKTDLCVCMCAPTAGSLNQCPFQALFGG